MKTLATDPRAVRLLTVGNSFAQNATRYLPQFVAASGVHRLALGEANIGGCSLERHWRHAQQHEADPDGPEGSPYSGRCLREILRAEPWDVVTIQQYRWLSHDVETYRPFARNLHDYIRTHAPQAEIMLHQTWAYRVDDEGRLGPEYSQEDMHRDARQAYRTVASELGIRIIPVGDVFAMARRHPEWTFTRDPAFDYENPPRDELPCETHSLCRGWYWTEGRDGRPMFACDTHHAGPAGEYLGAVVFYETIFGERADADSFVPTEIAADEARFLCSIAHQTVSTHSLPS